MLHALYPLEITDRDTSCVRQDIGDAGYSAILQDTLCLRGGGAISSLYDQASFDAGSVAMRDLVLQRCGHQDITREFQQFPVGYHIGAGQANQATMLTCVAQSDAGINAVAVIHASSDIAQ